MTSLREKIKDGWRHWLVLSLVCLALVGMLTRAVFLQIKSQDYLQAQGEARYQRVIETSPVRGKILDRFDRPLAISSPVDSVWADPGELMNSGKSIKQLAGLLETSTSRINSTLSNYQNKQFVYLKRHVRPEISSKVEALGLPGVHISHEYRRYYPAGAVAGQLLGFTNIDDIGLEGLERTFDDLLKGTAGKMRVLRDRKGHFVEGLERISPVIDGDDLTVSIDARIQYLAYRQLHQAVNKHRASGGSAVVIDVTTGEVLAMVNDPGFNPNDRKSRRSHQFRNRVVTDLFEPGSTVKPFVIAMALQSKQFGPDTRVDTSPGKMTLSGRTISDTHNYGLLTVARVLIKSSNIGAAKIALSFTPQHLIKTLETAGFGQPSGLEIGGEARGGIPDRRPWRPIEHATLAYGYGIQSSVLKLAHAYSVLASGGVMRPLSLLPVEAPVAGKQVFDPIVIKQVQQMMEQVVSRQGTASLAALDDYRVAGKTGTVHKLIDGSYDQKRYRSLFAGFAPVSNPRLAMAIMIDDPRGDQYFGGAVAGPVFRDVMLGALRLMNVAPDKLSQQAQQKVAWNGVTG